ncbi:DUF6985 domain-containing protein [Variovorax sp. ZT5P49]|uniref:DUF6985 domain-containing protein n=1 Tax=Variovorax sp. ZT5P49 TaxID=3443733 RepID=UPI003F4475A1
MNTRAKVSTGKREFVHPVLGQLKCVYATEIHPQWYAQYGIRLRPLPVAQTWELANRLALFGQPDAITVRVSSADWAKVLEGTHEEGDLSEGQVDAYEAFVRELAAIEPQVALGVLEHYRECIEWTDYGHDNFKPVDSPEPLLQQCHQWELQIGPQRDGPREFHLLCKCPWDGEHGFIAEFRDEKLMAPDH